MPAARTRRAGLLALALVAMTLAACGGGERQDEDEPTGEFPVEVVRAEFPDEQKLAKDSVLEIEVRNVGDEAIPNVSVTVDDFHYRKDVNPEEDKTGLADPERPVFVINEIPIREPPGGRDTERLDPLERSSAYVDTYPLGALEPDDTVTFRWDVTAVKAGPYCVAWTVNAGLDGKAEAVLRDEQPETTCDDDQTVSRGPATERPTGAFAGVISDEAPDARIGPDGKTVIKK